MNDLIASEDVLNNFNTGIGPMPKMIRLVPILITMMPSLYKLYLSRLNNKFAAV